MEAGKDRGSNPQPQVGRDILPPAVQQPKIETQPVPVAQPAASVQPTAPRVEYNPISDAPDSDAAVAAEEAEFADLVQNINVEQQKNADKTQSAKNQKAGRRHRASKTGLLAAVLALMVAVGLGVAAYFAFQGDQTKTSSQPAKVATSTEGAEAIKEAGNSVISPNDLDGLSKSADSLGSLNDSEEFSTGDLTDQALGL